MTKVIAIAAIGRNRVLGNGNKLLWHIPDDLKRFKELTRGHPVIMGRKTFESILGYLGKPLPERENIVVTRSAVLTYPGVIAASSIGEALEKARACDADDIFIIGGAQIYEAALPYTDALQVTIIDDEKEGDAFFPPYEHLFRKVREEEREWQGLGYSWSELERQQ